MVNNDDISTAFQLDEIGSYEPMRIARFLIALANEEIWAIAALDVDKGDSPSDELASFWSNADASTRESLIKAAIIALDIHSPAMNNSERSIVPEKNTLNLLEFFALIAPYTSAQQIKDFAPSLRDWLYSGCPSHSATAARCLSTLRDLDALAYLDTFCSTYPERTWAVPALLYCKSQISPFDALPNDYELLRFSIEDVSTQLSIQECLERMMNSNVERCTDTLRHTTKTWPKNARILIGEMLEDLGGLQFHCIRTFLDELNNNTTQEALATGFKGATNLLDQAETFLSAETTLGLLKKYSQDLTQHFGALENSQHSKHWLLLAAHLEGHAKERRCTQLLDTYIKTALETGSDLSNIKMLQDKYCDAHWGTAHNLENLRMEVVQNLSKALRHIPSVPANCVPRKLRIAGIEFAEDIYLELLRLLILAKYPSITVERIGGVKWDKLDTALLAGEVDIGLNNDDILSYDTERPEAQTIYRMAGDPFYKFDTCILLANADHLVSRGIERHSIIQTKKHDHFEFLLSTEERHRETLVDILKDANLAATPDSILSRSAEELLENLGLNQSITETHTDWGLDLFLRGDIPLYVGGTIQAKFALEHWSKAVPLIPLRNEVVGRLFASKEFYLENSEFADGLIEVWNQVQNVWESIRVFNRDRLLETYLIAHINVTMRKSVPEALTTVHSIDQIKSMLDLDTLSTKKNKNRKWEEFNKTKSKETVTSMANYMARARI